MSSTSVLPPERSEVQTSSASHKSRIALALILAMSLVGLVVSPGQASANDNLEEIGDQLSSGEAQSLADQVELTNGLQSSLDPDPSGPQAWEYGDNSFLIVTSLQDNFEDASFTGAIVDHEGAVVQTFETAMTLVSSDVVEVTSWVDGKQTAQTTVSQDEGEAINDGQMSTMSGGFFDRLANCLENDLGISGWAAGALAAVCAAACIGTAGAGCVACAAGVLGITGGQAGYCVGQAQS